MKRDEAQIVPTSIRYCNTERILAHRTRSNPGSATCSFCEGDRRLSGRTASLPLPSYPTQKKGNGPPPGKELAKWERDGLMRDLKEVHRGSFKFILSGLLLFLAVVLLGVSIWAKDNDLDSDTSGSLSSNLSSLSLLLSLLCFSTTWFMWTKEKKHRCSNGKSAEERSTNERIQFKTWNFENLDAGAATADVSEARKLSEKQRRYITTSTKSKSTDYSHASKKYERASRASSLVTTASSTKSEDDQKDNLILAALNSLTALNSKLTLTVFKIYITRMREFISKNVLEKLVNQGVSNSDDAVIDTMFTVGTYRYCKNYVRDRVSKLCESRTMTDQKGNGGVSFNGKEWSHNEFPSDNEIVLHILSTLMSVLMTGGRRSKGYDPVFEKKHLNIARNENQETKDPVIESAGDIVLCVRKNWTRFYILMKDMNGVVHSYEAMPGDDSMYWAITLFFWLVKEKKDFALDDADLSGARIDGICMSHIFE